MGIEPTQPDVVRSRTVLKTVRATRLHPLPAASRKHETVMLLLENLTDLEGVMADMDRNPHHREYMKQLESVIVSGTSTWKVFREHKLISE